MQLLKKATDHFLDFHKGSVNIILHVIGFAGVFCSVFYLSWKLFALSLIVLESGHVYNHLIGIKPYDVRLKVFAWRILFFVLLIFIFYVITVFIKQTALANHV
jgi:hypothetical protein